MNYFERISLATGRSRIDRRMAFEAPEPPEPEVYYDIANRDIHVSEAVVGPTNLQADPSAG